MGPNTPAILSVKDPLGTFGRWRLGVARRTTSAGRTTSGQRRAPSAKRSASGPRMVSADDAHLAVSSEATSRAPPSGRLLR
jgi:hypothetical protein